MLDDLDTEFPGCIFVSAHRALNINRLLQQMQEAAEQTVVSQTLLIPYESMNMVAKIYDIVEVLHRFDLDEGVKLVVKIATDKTPYFIKDLVYLFNRNKSTYGRSRCTRNRSDYIYCNY